VRLAFPDGLVLKQTALVGLSSAKFASAKRFALKLGTDETCIAKQKGPLR
jgi:hypothetical protein